MREQPGIYTLYKGRAVKHPLRNKGIPPPTRKVTLF